MKLKEFHTKQFIENLSISKKLLLIISIPILIAVSLTSNEIYTKYTSAEHATQTIEIQETSRAIQHLIHELQIERGLSTGYVTAKDPTIRSRLLTQYNNTDLARESLDEAIQSSKSVIDLSTKKLLLLDQHLVRLHSIRANIKEATREDISHYTISRSS